MFLIFEVDLLGINFNAVMEVVYGNKMGGPVCDHRMVMSLGLFLERMWIIRLP